MTRKEFFRDTKRVLIVVLGLAALLWVAHTLWASEESEATDRQTDSNFWQHQIQQDRQDLDRAYGRGR